MELPVPVATLFTQLNFSLLLAFKSTNTIMCCCFKNPCLALGLPPQIRMLNLTIKKTEIALSYEKVDATIKGLTALTINVHYCIGIQSGKI